MEELNQETVVETTENPTEGYQSPGIGDMLQGNAPETVTEPEVLSDAPSEVEGDISPETANVSVPAVQPTQPVVPQAPQITPEIQVMIDKAAADKTRGIIAALSGEREKRQRLEQQLGGVVPVEEAEAATQSLRGQLLTMSENNARRHYPDFQPVYNLFTEEAGQNPALLETVLSSPDPGEAAYQAGLQVKLVRELGQDVIGNPYKLLEKGEQRGYEKARAELTKEFEMKLLNRAGEKQKTPTDISQARSTGGNTVPYRSPSLGELLKKNVR